MRQRQWTGLLCLTTIATIGCSDQTPTMIREQTQLSHLLVPGDGPGGTNPTGGPSSSSDYVRVALAGAAPNWVAGAEAGFFLIGSGGDISMQPTLKGDLGATIKVDPIFVTMPPGSPQQQYTTPAWSRAVTGTCGVSIEAEATFHSYWLVNGIEVQPQYYFAGAPPKTGPPCGPPSVEVHPPTINIDAGTSFSVDGFVAAGSGTLKTVYWVLDNGPTQADPDMSPDKTMSLPQWTGSVSCGSHTLTLTAANSLGLTKSASVSITATACDVDNGGGGQPGVSYLCYRDTWYYLDTGEIISQRTYCLQEM
jgi:hypothetical protein